MSIRKSYESLAAEIAAIDAKAAPLVARGKAISAQIQPLLAEQREITEKLAAYRGADYAAKRKLLGQMAVALGGKSLKAEAMR